MPQYFASITTEGYQDNYAQMTAEHQEKLNNYLAGRPPIANKYLKDPDRQIPKIERNVRHMAHAEVVPVPNYMTFKTILCCDDEYGPQY